MASQIKFGRSCLLPLGPVAILLLLSSLSEVPMVGKIPLEGQVPKEVKVTTTRIMAMAAATKVGWHDKEGVATTHQQSWFPQQ